MATPAAPSPPERRDDAPAGRPFAVVDVGSNSVRLVVFEGLARAPLPLFNEKSMCGLGRGLGTRSPDWQPATISIAAPERIASDLKRWMRTI